MSSSKEKEGSLAFLVFEVFIDDGHYEVIDTAILFLGYLRQFIFDILRNGQESASILFRYSHSYHPFFIDYITYIYFLTN